MDVEVADAPADGRRFWVGWRRRVAPGDATELGAPEADAGRHLGYVRAAGRRRADAPPSEPAVSGPTRYEGKPLLRDAV